MHLITLITTILLLSPLTLAATVCRRDEWQPSASSLACLYMTNEAGWHGEGLNICEVPGKCSGQLPDGLAKNVSSAGPTEGITCFLYDGEDCTGTGSAPIVYPGYANLSDPAINFSKRAQSWRCWKYCGYLSSSASISATATPSAGSSTLAATTGTKGLTTIIASASSSSSSATQVSITNTVGATSSPSSATSVAITSTIGASSTTSTSAPSSAMTEGPASLASTSIVMTHTFADGSTELTTIAMAMPT